MNTSIGRIGIIVVIIGTAIAWNGYSTWHREEVQREEAQHAAAIQSCVKQVKTYYGPLLAADYIGMTDPYIASSYVSSYSSTNNNYQAALKHCSE